MQFAAALVEYLVSGIFAAVWVVPLLWRLFGLTPPVDDGWLVIYLPAAYVLGIYVDASASVLLALLRRKKKTAAGESYRRTTHILGHGSEALGQAMQVYVSRDRIARGVFLNATLSAAILPLILPDQFKASACGVAVVVAVWSFLVWSRLDNLSNSFKENALDLLPPMKPRQNVHSEEARA